MIDNQFFSNHTSFCFCLQHERFWLTQCAVHFKSGQTYCKKFYCPGKLPFQILLHFPS